MKTIEMFSNKPVFSAEVFPPKKSGNMEIVIRALKGIQPLKPDFVSVTYGAGGDGAETTADVASVAKDALDIETVAHMTCVNMTMGKLEAQLDILKKKQIENILVLRGDVTDNSRFYDFTHANELAAYIKKNHPNFNLIGACYPEKHPEAATLNEDVDNLKRKIDCGVSELITQLFFDNSAFFRFRETLIKAGIDVPLEAGIMPIASRSTVEKTIKLSNASIPLKLKKVLELQNDDDLYDGGLDFAIGQIDELIREGADGIHLYTMNKADVARRVFEAFEGVRR